MAARAFIRLCAKELEDTLLQGQWKPDDDLSDHYRRSIYVFARRNLRYPIFETFDRPEAVASCPIRNNSTTAIQSLELLNGPLAIESSAALCDSLLASNSAQLPHAAILDQLYIRCFARHPSEQRRASCQLSSDRPWRFCGKAAYSLSFGDQLKRVYLHRLSLPGRQARRCQSQNKQLGRPRVRFVGQCLCFPWKHFYDADLFTDFFEHISLVPA